MNSVSQIELKAVCFDVLRHFAEFCKNNNLQYCLCGGTLLGCIRHQGFIPWDDDIDVAMPREDYDRLIEIYRDSDEYKLVCHEKNQGYYYPFAKIYDTKTLIIEEHFECEVEMGIYIDIFPLDGDGDIYESSLKHLLLCQNIQHKLNHAFCRHFFRSDKHPIIELMRYIRYLGIRMIGREYFYEKLVKMTRRYGFNESKYVAINVWESCGENELLEREWFDEYMLGNFEGEEFFIPKEFDKVLSRNYGDYMTPPPKEKQISHHDMQVYWRDEIKTSFRKDDDLI